MVLPTAALFDHLGFNLTNPWVPDAAPVCRSLVDHAVRRGWVQPEPFRVASHWSPRQHLARIATLVRDWDGGLAGALTIEVDEYGCGSIFDGCHRLSAAWYRQHPTVRVSLSGYVDEYPAFFDDLAEDVRAI